VARLYKKLTFLMCDAPARLQGGSLIKVRGPRLAHEAESLIFPTEYNKK